MDELTLELAKEMFPLKLRSNITQETIDKINEMSIEPEVAHFYRDNLMTYTSVLLDGKYNISDYINGMKYITYKFMGDTNKSAYAKTFPERMDRMLKKGISEKKINSFITAYNKGSMITKIFERSIIPKSIVYRDLFHDAVMVNADLMVSANSEMVRHKAATTLMEQLAPPVDAKIELDINVKQESSIVDKYEKALIDFSQNIQNEMKKGGDINRLNNIKINTDIKDAIDVEASEKNS